MKLLGKVALIWLGLGLTGCDKFHADLTKQVSGKCEIHGTEMTKTNVPIIYGLVRQNEYGRARQAISTNSFPHAENCVLGGCIVGTPTQAVIYVCSDCQKALQKWENKRETPTQPR
jgi:hypothetical protein